MQLKREILEEIGLDVSHAAIRQLGDVATGKSEKTLIMPQMARRINLDEW